MAFVRVVPLHRLNSSGVARDETYTKAGRRCFRVDNACPY